MMPSDIRHKEPAYFSDIYGIRRLDEYVSLFSEVTNEKMIGEASGTYLTSPESPIRIKKMIPDAKFIIILRNPADRAYSLYNWMAREGYEYIGSFEKALEVEVSHRHGNTEFMNSNPEYYYDYLYFHSGLYSQQIQRYFDTFPREQILFLLFEEFANDLKTSLRKVFAFLGVHDTFVPSFEIHNKGCVPYSAGLQFLFRQNLRPLLCRLRIRGTDRIVSILIKVNTRPGKPPPMKEETRKMLIERYAEDVQRTGELINRDLSNWLRTE